MNDNIYKGSKEDKLSQKGWMSYQDEEEEDFGGSDDDKPSENGDKSKTKKKYSVIPQAVREKFIKRVLSKEVTIKEAAKEFGLKFSTSKAILQTYKKEGRIGKKKNRERKTKVVNAVFIANISPGASFMNTLPSLPLSDIKNLNASTPGDANTTKSYDPSLNKLIDQKFGKGAFANGYNKMTQNIIREFGNDFLRDFIEKNFSQNKFPSLGLGNLERNLSNSNIQDNNSNASNVSSSINLPNLASIRHSIDCGTSNSNKGANPSAFSISNLAANSFLLPQKTSSSNSDAPLGGLGQTNLVGFNQNKFLNPGKPDTLFQQRQSFKTYGKNSDFESRNEQISDISVKKFKSGEEALWEYDMDQSKKDLEDFIYKTHNVLRNNMEKPALEQTTSMEDFMYKTNNP